jgi:hypothetical protein
MYINLPNFIRLTKALVQRKMKWQDMEGEPKFLSVTPKGCNLEGGMGVFPKLSFFPR